MKALHALNVVGSERVWVLIVVAVIAVYALTPHDLKPDLIGLASGLATS